MADRGICDLPFFARRERQVLPPLPGLDDDAIGDGRVAQEHGNRRTVAGRGCTTNDDVAAPPTQNASGSGKLRSSRKKTAAPRSSPRAVPRGRSIALAPPQRRQRLDGHAADRCGAHPRRRGRRARERRPAVRFRSARRARRAVRSAARTDPGRRRASASRPARASARARDIGRQARSAARHRLLVAAEAAARTGARFADSMRIIAEQVAAIARARGGTTSVATARALAGHSAQQVELRRRRRDAV